MGADKQPPTTLSSTAEVESLASQILPSMPLRFVGVSHVVAGTVRGEDLEVFRVGHPGVPKSRWDRFVLDLSRLRADAIVITGAILRAEPDLCYAFDEGWAGAFAALRSSLGRRERPLLLVLTRRGVDPRHAAFDSNVECVVVRDAPSLAHVFDLARERGARSISVEAGPQTTAELYGPSPLLDELLLHRFDASIPDDARVGAFATALRVRELFGPPQSRVALRDGATQSVVERYAR
jgi:hypothetical protein